MEIAKMSLSKSLFSFVRIFLFIIAFVDVCIAVNLNEISSGNEQIELTLDRINTIEDEDVKNALIQMLKDKSQRSGYENNTFFIFRLISRISWTW